MKKIFKNLLSLVLATVMIVTVMLPMTASAADITQIPIVYVRGRRSTIVNSSGKKIYPLKTTIQDALIKDAGKLSLAFADAMATNNWERYGNALYNSIEPIYRDLVLDNNGNIKNGSKVVESDPPQVKKKDFTTGDYVFQYDSRIDPLASAVKLNAYINAVKKATGAKKVNLVGRCLGSSVVASYLTKYGGASVESVIMYASACNGILPIGAAFSGKINIDSNALSRYTDQSLNDEESFNGFIKAMVELSRQARLLGYSAESINSIYLKVADQILPKLLLATYATMPCYWSMVSDEYYSAAKKFIFKNDTKKYAGLIQKIDNYHNNVQKKLPSTLKNLKKQGVKVSVIAKYNVRLAPVFENCNIQADGTVELKTMSFGATSSVFGKVLPKSYIDKANAAGRGKYISKDGIIDASTCLFPDSTWFIKNNEHTDFPLVVNKLICAIFNSKGQYTVTSNKNFPQYLEYVKSSNKLVPVTAADPKDIYDDSEVGSSANVLVALIRTVATIVGVFAKILGGIIGIG